ncbi:gustatory receptor for sugar taste 43a-like [Dendroctonus ponderosae]|uniref:gustatory receptor for sugar taste 43a-like n=1 Tax=Dendroctonus ponderosae TaxID=77166 RepID=UPI00203552E1|nr:gustatory receptor for sugar taste 43a-like [Dendroctonus ponderosae]
MIGAYDNILMASVSFNNLYGPSLTAILVNVIACLVLTPYVLYQQILNAKEYGFLFTQSYWMTCHVLRLLFLIHPCHEGHKQAIRLKRTTVKLAATDWPKDVHKQIKLLLLQVSENKIEFNAAGLTLINRTLLPTIGSAVFTYLAILFQYKNNT